MARKKDKPNARQTDARFARVVQAFERERTVSRGRSKGFGSGALRVNSKIFAMLSSKGEFVLKLPKERVDELVLNGAGQRFDPGHGRVMKEWLVVKARSADWLELAREACEFVKQGKLNWRSVELGR